MRFGCLDKSCDKEFVYPAKITVQRQSMLPNDLIEKHVCPYCLSLNFDELPKDSKGTNDSVTEVVSVPHAEAAAKVKEGYKVYGIYAKETVCVKRNLNET